MFDRALEVYIVEERELKEIREVKVKALVKCYLVVNQAWLEHLKN
jgi:hypothetical protein